MANIEGSHLILKRIKPKYFSTIKKTVDIHLNCRTVNLSTDLEKFCRQKE